MTVFSRLSGLFTVTTGSGVVGAAPAVLPPAPDCTATAEATAESAAGRSWFRAVRFTPAKVMSADRVLCGRAGADTDTEVCTTVAWAQNRRQRTKTEGRVTQVDTVARAS